MILQASLKAVIETNIAVSETDFRPELPKIKVPTLILHGDLDQSTPLELTGWRTAKLLPNCRLKVHEGARHVTFLTHPKPTAHDIAAFISND